VWALTLSGARSSFTARSQQLWLKKIFRPGSGRGRPLGNIRVDLPNVPPKDGPRKTSRSEVFDFTVGLNDRGLGEALSHLLFLHSYRRTVRPPLVQWQAC